MSDNPNGYDFGKGLSSGIKDDIDWDQWLAELDTTTCPVAIEVRTEQCKPHGESVEVELCKECTEKIRQVLLAQEGGQILSAPE